MTTTGKTSPIAAFVLRPLTRFPLRALIMAFLAITSLILGAYLYHDSITDSNRRVQKEAQDDMKQRLAPRQAVIEYLISNNHWERLQEEIASMGTDPNIQSAFLVDDQNKIIASIRRFHLGHGIEEMISDLQPAQLTRQLNTMKRAKDAMTGIIYLTDDKKSLMGIYPVILDKGRTGLIIARVDLSRLYATSRHEAEIQVLEIMILAVTLLTFLWLMFHVLLTQRAAQLIAAARQFAGGDLKARSALDGKDELATIGLAFDHMADEVSTGYQRLAEKETELRQVMEAAEVGAWSWNSDTNEVWWSPTTYALFGMDPENSDITYEKYMSFQHPEDKEYLASSINRALKEGGHYAVEHRIILPGGTIRWLSGKGRVLRNDNGRITGMRGLVWDITARKNAEEEIFQQKERAEVTLHSIGDAVITTDNRGMVDYLNPVAEGLTGWSAQEAVGKPLTHVFHIINEKTRKVAINPVERCLREGHIVGLANHTALISRDGSETSIEDTAAPIRNRKSEIIGVVLVFHDVSKARKMAEQLSWQASHDSLTGLINRHDFETGVTRAINSARHDKLEHTLLYLDLDQFKVINDTCGHTAGDKLLKELSTLIQTKMRNTDILGRLGGDEFGVLLQQCHIDQGMRIADALRRLIKDYHFVWDNRPYGLSVSIGMVGITPESGELESVLAAADMACYAAKERGRNRIHIFKTDDSEMLKRHGEMQWISRITQAIEHDHFRLYRQTIQPVSPNSDQGIHYEVLLRLLNPDGTIIAPGAFMPAAERYNLMPAIDRWVISSFFAAYKKLFPEHTYSGNHFISINLSGDSINDHDFLNFLRHQFVKHGVPPQAICFEITETVAIANLNKAQSFIKDLKSWGCRFALDDFGSGLSSFGYLKNLPVDLLKIDGAFVRNMINDTTDLAMVESINQIGHLMGMQTVAEYVENRDILEKLREIGVDYAQGYGIEEPRPLFPVE